ncbi:MAG: hypothetical protein M3083_02505 [Actinomycetota bacterium]|nr:hypothetical protein [Actinomycetota bacterium]MDQ6947622.1 hypothetical protein [Actinomycetota bacterium]
MPTVFSLTGKVAGPDQRGAAMGTVTTIAYLGFVLAPEIAGILTSTTGLRLALGLVALAAVSLGFLGARAPVPINQAELPPEPHRAT